MAAAERSPPFSEAAGASATSAEMSSAVSSGARSGSSAASSSVSCTKWGKAAFSWSTSSAEPAMGSSSSGSVSGAAGPGSAAGSEGAAGAAAALDAAGSAVVTLAAGAETEAAGCSCSAASSSAAAGSSAVLDAAGSDGCFLVLLCLRELLSSQSTVTGATVRPAGWEASRMVVPAPPMVSAKAMTRAATACPTPRWDRFADVSFETDENLCFIPLAFPPKIIGQRPPRGKNEPG